ncbi:hypothetical protein WA158_000644 [Blastocystis sp. Blastoise]
MGSKKDRRLTFWQQFISGGIAGAGSRTFTSPLDVVKIIAQVGSAQHKGFIGTFKNIIQEEGWKGLWKGNFVACLRLFPYNAIQFAAFNSLKIMFTDAKTGKMSATNAAIAGSTGGIIATCSVYPLDMVKTRLTIQSKVNPKYNGIVDAFKKIYKEEGFLAFYKGMLASILGVIPFSGATFMGYEVLAVMWGKPRNELSGWQNFVNGCLAGAFAQTFSFPFDTVRKKMQAQSCAMDGPKADVEFNGLWDCFAKTIKAKGVLGLWKGTVANLVKVTPYAGLMFWFNEICKNYYLHKNGYTTSAWKPIPKEGINQFWTPEELKAHLAEQAAAAAKIEEAPKTEEAPKEN